MLWRLKGMKKSLQTEDNENYTQIKVNYKSINMLLISF